MADGWESHGFTVVDGDDLHAHERTTLEDGRQQRGKGGEERYTDAWYPFEADMPSGGMKPTSNNDAAGSVAFHERWVSHRRADDHGIDALLKGWKR